ncbi:16S rRNA (cytidine(1402)-2'-O)-methyltransferase [Hyphococcus lacteus]|uniref:Ribosomal RNA small subunit methyltransferase I n=1 Tax=Hyphococcus lacteus TaxID=3143536 RepID=A0ABV3Z3L5_9PROT
MPSAMINKDISPEPGLYVTATPIGNLADITYRAVQILKAADLILCEDTRQTAKLCAAYGIDTRRAPYHDHNAERARPGIIADLVEGAVICLVSDAGTPLISDPGFKLVRAARDAGIRVFPVPGASAAIAALCAAGVPSDQFHFAGFLPPKQGARQRLLERLANIDATLIFYESAPRLSASLGAMAEVLGPRRAVVARELTKMHEEFREDTLGALSSVYEEKAPKGEIVIVVFPPEQSAPEASDIDAFLVDALKSMSVKEAASAAAEILGIPRKEAYGRALDLKNA